MHDVELERVVLRDEESGLDAAFVPGAGMLCCSLRHRGEELLAQNAGVDAYARVGKTMAIPLLYPWANRLAGFDYSVAGRIVRIPHDPTRVRLDGNGLPIHGVIGGRQVWELLDAPEGERSALAASLSWSDSWPELFELFPFRHDLHYDARLAERRLEIEVTVHACGADEVPISFGFHPYFSPPGAAREDWQIELPAMRALALDAQQIPAGLGRAVAAENFELDGREFDDGFDAVASSARFSVTAADRRIVLTFLEGYPCAQVIAPTVGQFICFEPMTAPANALRSGEGLTLLAPGERYAARFSVAVADRS
jgi:galactose mutarotase-like enzyme